MKHFISFLLLIVTLHANVFSQSPVTNVNGALLEKTFSYYNISNSGHRKIIALKNQKVITKINPINYIAAGLLFFYQSILSEQIQANCTYEVSCSNYTKLCIEKDGFIKGSLKGIHQLSNCFPSSVDECPRYKISGNLKINNQIEAD